MGLKTVQRPTFVLIVRVSMEGVASFQEYEGAALPLLREFGGLLERRLRNSDGTVEVHIVSFDSEQSFQRFRSDPRRASHAHLMEKASAMNELIAMADVS
ncbi:MAG: hypothetical protein E7813_02150 [Bradyrhizobium sp.]|nr:MAG: hypothetical protein E7813_02150 [Bradyrhizobium sp.]